MFGKLAQPQIESASQVVSEVVSESSVSRQSSDVITPQPTDHTLKIGDSIKNSSGNVAQIIKTAAGGWLTSNGHHISRDDLKAGVYVKVAVPHSELSEVEASASILIGCANEIDDRQLLIDIVQDWTQERKREVWKLLTPEFRQKYTNLMKTTEDEVGERNG